MHTNRSRILIIRLSSIGDIVLSSSFIRQVRKTYPAAHIDYLVKKEFAELVQYNPNLDNILLLDPVQGLRGLKALRKQLHAVGYDYVFDIHNNYRSNYLHWGLFKNAKSKIKKSYIKRALLVLLKFNLYNKIIPIPLRYLEVAKKAKVMDDQLGLEIFWPEDVERNIEAMIPKNLGNKFIILAPGAGFFTKTWPLDYFQKLMEMILKNRTESLILIGGKTDPVHYQDLLISQRVFSFIAKLNLLESAALIKRARVVVSNDSGVMHLSAAVGTPVLAIFGSTVEELGFFPFRAKHLILQNQHLKCRPCSHIGKNHCPLKHFKCMRDLTPEMAYEYLLKLNQD